VNYTVDLCPPTRLDGGLQSLHDASEDTVYSLESMATSAFAKWKWPMYQRF